MLLASRRGLQSEHLRGFGVGQLFKVPQGDDLAVHLVHAVEGGLQLQLDLNPLDRLARRGHLAQELGGQRNAAGLRQRPAMQRHLAADVAKGSAQVLPVQAHQALPGGEPQPQVERHLRLRLVGRQLLGDIEIGLLQDVGRIEPPLQAAVQTQPDHCAKSLAITAKQLGQRRGITGGGAVDQRVVSVSGTCGIGHGRVHTYELVDVGLSRQAPSPIFFFNRWEHGEEHSDCMTTMATQDFRAWSVVSV